MTIPSRCRSLAHASMVQTWTVNSSSPGPLIGPTCSTSSLRLRRCLGCPQPHPIRTLGLLLAQDSDLLRRSCRRQHSRVAVGDRLGDTESFGADTASVGPVKPEWANEELRTARRALRQPVASDLEAVLRKQQD